MSLLCAVIQEANKTNTEDIAKARNELLPKIKDITERLQVFAWGLQNYYTDVYLTSDSSRSLEHMNYKNRKYKADSDLNDLEGEINNFQTKFGNKSEEINNACKKLATVTKSFQDSCTLVDGTYIIQKAARDLKSLKYVDAIVNLKDLHTRLDKIESQGNLAKAMHSFRGLSETQLAVSQGILSVEFSKLFTWYFNNSVHALTYSLSVQQNDPVLLETVLRALYIADQMITDIQPFSDFFVNVLVPNVIKHNCEIFTEDRLGALVFNIKIDLNDNDHPSIPTIFNNLTAAFEFLETTMGAKFEANRTFFQNLGDCNRGEFFNRLIQDCIKNNLPSCENSLQAYKEIVLEVETFNKFLVDLKYVDADESPLKKYIDHTDLLMYDTKCKKMLTQVRELIKENLSQKTIVFGSEQESCDKSILNVTCKEFRYDLNGPLFFPKCVISHNVKKIATIIMTYLEESAKLPTEYSDQFVPYIKDIAVMYQAMVIQKNTVRLNTCPFELALFFNNCHYLAHCLVGPPWKNILPKEMADLLNTTLMSYIYDLRVVGIEKLSIYLKRNREEILLKITGTSHRWDLDEFETFNRNVNHVLALLEEMKMVWRNVLPSRMYERAMCTLVDALSEAMLRRTFWHVEEISEDVICLLASRYQYAMDEIQEIYPEIDTSETDIKYWDKLKLIPKLFTAQLLEISRMWSESDTVRRRFTCEEIRFIIKTRFPSNDYQVNVLKGIQ